MRGFALTALVFRGPPIVFLFLEIFEAEELGIEEEDRDGVGAWWRAVGTWGLLLRAFERCRSRFSFRPRTVAEPRFSFPSPLSRREGSVMDRPGKSSNIGIVS
jgi:hypothetical protein